MQSVKSSWTWSGSRKSWYTCVIREESETSAYGIETGAKPKRNGGKKGKLKLDEIMRTLFSLSDQATLHLINGLFHESFSMENTSIRYGNSQFINDGYGRVNGDHCITLSTLDTPLQHDQFHIEFQTLNDKTMLVRMFRYGFEKALELAAHGDLQDRTKGS
jgi:hypothetical protein